MEMLETMKHRRSIRKYLDKRVEREKLTKIMEAGIFAPNPGGRQGTKIIMIDDTDLIDKIGIINANCENRNWEGRGVSVEQPSIIDDLSIKSGFYGCSALGIVCVPKQMATKVNGIGSAFVCAENMVLEAYDLGVSSCIVDASVSRLTASSAWDISPMISPSQPSFRRFLLISLWNGCPACIGARI